MGVEEGRDVTRVPPRRGGGGGSDGVSVGQSRGAQQIVSFVFDHMNPRLADVIPFLPLITPPPLFLFLSFFFIHLLSTFLLLFYLFFLLLLLFFLLLLLPLLLLFPLPLLLLPPLLQGTQKYIKRRLMKQRQMIML